LSSFGGFLHRGIIYYQPVTRVYISFALISFIFHPAGLR
jgi:hypothetical protein